MLTLDTHFAVVSEAYHDWSGEAADAQLRVNFTLKLLLSQNFCNRPLIRFISFASNIGPAAAVPVDRLRRPCFVPGLVMFIRNCFSPSNGLSEPTGSISVTLKSREQGTSSPPCARSVEYFLRPVTVHSIVATSRCKNSEPRCQCPMIVPFSQPQRINRKCFRGLFHTPTLQPPPPILLYIRGSLECYISF